MTSGEFERIYEILDTQALPTPAYCPGVEEIETLVQSQEDFDKYAPYLFALSETFPKNKEINNKINDFCNIYVFETDDVEEEEKKVC